MSRTFTDDRLLTWEAFATGGNYGLAQRPKIVFQCLSDPAARARFVVHGEGDEADAEGAVANLPDDRLRALLAESRELE